MSVRLSLSVYVTFVAFSDCESCTRSISTSPGSMEAGEYGRTRGCVSSHAVSSWTRSPSCCGFRGVFWAGRFLSSFFFDLFFFERTRPAASMRPPCIMYVSTSNQHVFQGPFGQHHHLCGNVIMRQSRDSEATEVVFCLGAKKPLHGVVRTGYHYLISLSVCLPVCLSACV